jgi:hypothetical protein
MANFTRRRQDSPAHSTARARLRKNETHERAADRGGLTPKPAKDIKHGKLTLVNLVGHI